MQIDRKPSCRKVMHIAQCSSRRYRRNTVKAFNLWFNIDDKQLNIISEALQMLHNASLLIDDIEDNSNMRRGVPVAHHIYGVATTINAANYAYFLGLEKILQLPSPEVTKVFTEQLLELHRGQGKDIYWRENYVCPAEDEYKMMAIGKTGGMFSLAVRLMQLLSTNQNDFTKLIGNLGYCFQMRNDYSNLCSKEYTESKSFCEDLTEGKFSFPIIHAIHNYPDDTEIINILRQRTIDVDTKKYVMQLLLLIKFGSLKYTRNVMTDLDEQAINEIKRLGANLYLVNILDILRTWIN
ncbi:Geranylgeranyl pyrophosphate synthase, variant 4 [Chamberlinius hualienensis]